MGRCFDYIDQPHTFLGAVKKNLISTKGICSTVMKQCKWKGKNTFFICLPFLRSPWVQFLSGPKLTKLSKMKVKSSFWNINIYCVYETVGNLNVLSEYCRRYMHKNV